MINSKIQKKQKSKSSYESEDYQAVMPDIPFMKITKKEINKLQKGILFAQISHKTLLSKNINCVRYILVDWGYHIYYGEVILNMGDKPDKKELSIYNKINRTYKPPRKWISKQANVPCGYGPMEWCCCNRKINEGKADFWAGRSYNLVVNKEHLQITYYDKARKCRRPVGIAQSKLRYYYEFPLIIGLILGFGILLDPYIFNCASMRRRYWVSDNVVGKKVGMLHESRPEMGKIIEERKKTLKTGVLINNIYPNLNKVNLIKVAQVNISSLKKTTLPNKFYNELNIINGKLSKFFTQIRNIREVNPAILKNKMRENGLL